MDSPLYLEIRIFSEVGNRLMELVFNGDWELKTGKQHSNLEELAVTREIGQ